MTFMPQIIGWSIEQTRQQLREHPITVARDESKREAIVDLQAIVTKECQTRSNFAGSTYRQITKISEDAQKQLQSHGAAYKSLNLYVLIPDDVYEDERIEVQWDPTLISNFIFPHFKAVETLTLPTCRESIYSLSMLPSLCHLQLDSELMQYLGVKGIRKGYVTYSVDTKNDKLNQYLYQLLCKLFWHQSKGPGPTLKSLKITYHKDTVEHGFAFLDVIQKVQGGFVAKADKGTLDISITSPEVSQELLFLKDKDGY